jgi:hypothetical protein
MGLSLVLADSEVASVTHEAAGLCLRFAAAHVRRAAAGDEAGASEGYARGVTLVLGDARAAGLHAASAARWMPASQAAPSGPADHHTDAHVAGMDLSAREAAAVDRGRTAPADRLDDLATADLVGRLAHGRLAIDGRWTASLALPSTVSGGLILELGFAHGMPHAASGDVPEAPLVLHATRLSCRFEGEPNFAESLFC